MLSFSTVFTTECYWGRSAIKKILQLLLISSISLLSLFCFDFDFNQSQRTQTDIQKCYVYSQDWKISVVPNLTGCFSFEEVPKLMTSWIFVHGFLHNLYFHERYSRHHAATIGNLGSINWLVLLSLLFLLLLIVFFCMSFLLKQNSVKLWKYFSTKSAPSAPTQTNKNGKASWPSTFYVLWFYLSPSVKHSHKSIYIFRPKRILFCQGC